MEADRKDEWSRLLLRAWKISPAVAVHMGERFKLPHILVEITKLVRADPRMVVDVPEALHYLLGDRLDASSRSLLKVNSSHLSHAHDDGLTSSGCQSGRLSHPSPPWCTSNLDTAITLSSCNMLCVCLSSIQSSLLSSLFLKSCKPSVWTILDMSRDLSSKRRKFPSCSATRSSGI